MKDIKLELAEQIETVVSFLATAKMHDFISGPEASGIFKDILKETGYKKDKPVFKLDTAHKEEVKKEVGK